MSKGELRYSVDLHILVSPDQKEHMAKRNLSMGRMVRQMIDADMGKFDHDLAKLEERLAVVEPEYNTLKKRIEEIRLEKKRVEEERMAMDKRVEDAHVKLLELAKSQRNRVDLISKKYIKIYADMCGQTVDEMLAWLENEVKKKS